jgi:hypothetical protein
VLLAPEVAPGSIGGPDGPNVVDEPVPGGVKLVPGAAPVPGVVPGAVVGVAPGVGVERGWARPGSGRSLTRSGFTVVVPLGGGGPASGRPDIGGIFVLVGSLNAPLPVALVPGGVGSTGRGGTKSGRLSFMFGAFVPNGLRWSIELCASIVPAQLGSAYAARSAIRTSAGTDRSAASASSTTTGCRNSMFTPAMVLSPNLAPAGALVHALHATVAVKEWSAPRRRG